MCRRLPTHWSNWLSPRNPRRPRHPHQPGTPRLPHAQVYRLAPSLTAAIAAAGAAAALAGCGTSQAPGDASGSGGQRASGGQGAASSPASTASPSSSVSGSGSAPAAASCTAAGLKVRLNTAAAGVAAGSYYVPLEFTNITGQPCRLTGYPAVAFTSGAGGQQIGTAAAADRAVAAHTVVLSPGGTAHAWLQVLNTANYPASKCHPVTAAGLRVAAPGTQSASYVAHPVPACRAVIHGSEILTVHPVQQGRARRGTA
jgi:Protein of unknown function (DUF4232)